MHLPFLWSPSFKSTLFAKVELSVGISVTPSELWAPWEPMITVHGLLWAWTQPPSSSNLCSSGALSSVPLLREIKSDLPHVFSICLKEINWMKKVNHTFLCVSACLRTEANAIQFNASVWHTYLVADMIELRISSSGWWNQATTW